MQVESHSLIEQIPPILKSGGWVDVGHDSAIRLDGEHILHRLNGKTKRHNLDWLVIELPLLNYILKKAC